MAKKELEKPTPKSKPKTKADDKRLKLANKKTWESIGIALVLILILGFVLVAIINDDSDDSTDQQSQEQQEFQSLVESGTPATTSEQIDQQIQETQNITEFSDFTEETRHYQELAQFYLEKADFENALDANGQALEAASNSADQALIGEINSQRQQITAIYESVKAYQ